jgi:NADH dehydrogenase
MERRRLAVTGANGFVGRHVVRVARERGWDVLGVVRSEAAAAEVERAGGKPVVIASLEAATLAPTFSSAPVVVHLAQIGAETANASYENVNVGGTRRVVEAAAAAGARRIVFFSGLGVARYGMAPRTTNRYFLSKLAAEMALFRAPLAVSVFRPSYVVGPGDGLVRSLLSAMAAGRVERPGDGRYRMQPIAVADAVALVLAALERPLLTAPLVLDLVGPEPVSFARFVDRLARVARAQGRPADYQVNQVPIEDADEEAAAGGYRGMLSDELDCLLCDEVADHTPLEALLGRFLTPLEEALAAAVRAAP